MAWLVEEQDNGEEATSYHLFEQDGDTLKMKAILFDRLFVKRLKSALEWQDALGTGMMKLAQDGIVINAQTGKVWEEPKKKRTPRLVITPAKTRRKA